MRFWGLTPAQWRQQSRLDQADMIAHYREHHLRDSHARRMQRVVSEEMGRKKKDR